MSERIVSWPLIAVFLLGCQSEETVTWMEGAGFEWNGLNHRLSVLHFTASDSQVQMGVIGGTSTTGMITTLPDGCAFSECQELPVKDTSTAWVNWGKLTSRKAKFASAEVVFDVSRESLTEPVEFVFDKAPKDDVHVVISGFSWDTNAPLKDGPACYDPFNGWHPREMTIELGAVQFSEGSETVRVDVTGAFEAGESLESIRQCIDAVNEQAQVSLRVTLLAVTSKGEPVIQSLSQSATYEFGSKTNPEPQPDPEWSERPLELPTENHVLGWTGLSFRYHVDDPEQRGAYLRSLAFGLDLENEAAYGHATNFSPGTQITGFDYQFDGAAIAIPVVGDLTRGTVERQLEAVVGDDKSPILDVIDI